MRLHGARQCGETSSEPLDGSCDSSHTRDSACDPSSHNDLHDYYWFPWQRHCVSDCLPETFHAFCYQSPPRHIGLFRHNAVAALHALHCGYCGHCRLEFWEWVLQSLHHALLAVCPGGGVHPPHNQRGPIPYHCAAAGQADPTQSETADRRFMGVEPVCVPAIRSWVEDRGSRWCLGAVVCAGV